MKPPTAAVALTYSLGRSLYLPLTCRCNSATLPQTRGPGFVLPDDVVDALSEVRRLEGFGRTGVHEPGGGADSATNESAGGKRPLPPPSWPMVDVLPDPQAALDDDANSGRCGAPVKSSEVDDDGRAPTVQSLVAETLTLLERERQRYDSVVIAGEGEPTLRLGALLSVVRGLRSRPDICPPSIRVTTNGLCGFPASANSVHNQGGEIACSTSTPTSVACRMREAGVTGVSVALMTARPERYVELMRPFLLPSFSTAGGGGVNVEDSAHGVVLDFVRDAIDQGLDVEVTGVDLPGLDKAEAEALAAELGVVTPFRWRPYFP